MSRASTLTQPDFSLKRRIYTEMSSSSPSTQSTTPPARAGPRILPGGEQEVEHFSQTPEIRNRLQQDNVVVLLRRDQETDGRGSTGKLFSETLNTPATIPHCLVLFHDTLTRPVTQSSSFWLPITTCSVFYELGTGVCGFGNICHGGVQTTLLDDVTGVLGVLNARLQDGVISTKAPGAYLPSRNQGMLDLTRSLFTTQGLEVRFLRPLFAPRVIEVVAQLKEIDPQGGFYTVEAVIKDMAGKVYATAQTKWVLHVRHRSRL